MATMANAFYHLDTQIFLIQILIQTSLSLSLSLSATIYAVLLSLDFYSIEMYILYCLYMAYFRFLE